jgi:transglutaminase-like putative cysteine protease
MRYTIRHVTRFTYEAPITESMIEARMQPRSDGMHRCLHFALTTTPPGRVMMYQDHDGNTVHHFNIPARHARLTLTADALVESSTPKVPPDRLGPGAWAQLDALGASGESWEYLAPSTFARTTPLLDDFVRELALTRGDDPLVFLHGLMDGIYERFEYRPKSTRVDSPIDEALAARKGVCQDFAHIFIAIARQVGIPSRYVSGYLFRDGAHDRSPDAATHAWVESFLPELGWTGFDPTNRLVAADRHIRVAIGRDYADVPPTRGVFKGASAVRSELAVAVHVGPDASPLSDDALPFTPWMSRDVSTPAGEAPASQQQQQQQKWLGASFSPGGRASGVSAPARESGASPDWRESSGPGGRGERDDAGEPGDQDALRRRYWPARVRARNPSSTKRSSRA